MKDYAPLIMVGGFLAWGFAFVIVSDLCDWLRRR